MADIPLGHADYHRSVAKEARVQTRNRYFEQNPVLNGSSTALISRPGKRRWLRVGSGPIKGGGIYSQPGSFDDALFVVSGTEWWRVDVDGTTTLLQDNLLPGGASVSMAATGNIGTTPEFLFMADGRDMYVYTDNGYAKGTISGSPANGNTVQIGAVYYRWTNGSVDAGTPDGTAANPWLIKLGVINDGASWQSLYYAVGAAGAPGDDYSTALTLNSDVVSMNSLSNSYTVRASVVGIPGNGIPTTSTGTGIAWTAPALAGGGGPNVIQVQTPDDVGIVSLGYIASYVIAVPVQGQGVNGRFYWINPGETTIDPLDYATAERAPDPVFSVVVFGDQFWLPGSNTTEVWYFSGNPDSPVTRLQGVTFDRGTWEGTAIQVKESMMIVDSDGAVFQISGGLKRVSNPSIEERIREAIQYESSQILY